MNRNRQRRVSEELKKVITQIMREKIKDPRLSPMAGVSDVEVTRDFRYAKVYISVYDTDSKRESTIEALSHAAGYIRSELNHFIKLRRIPELTFFLDKGIEYSAKIAKILNETGIANHEEDH